MKSYPLVLILILCASLIGCGSEPAAESAGEPADVVTETESATRYELRGVIVERDPMANTLKIDHEAIGDWMGAMTMSFPVRGTDVQALPEVGETITATVHVDGTEFWLTDIAAAPAEQTNGDDAATEEMMETITDEDAE